MDLNVTTGGITPSPPPGTYPGTDGRVSQWEAGLNLAAAMVKKAVLDAHPNSTVPEERADALESVRAMLLDKPDLMKWAEGIWEMPYKKASRKVADKRFFAKKSAKRIAGFRRAGETVVAANRAALPDGYMLRTDAAKVIGMCPNTLTLYRERGKIKGIFHQLAIGKKNTWIYHKDDVERFAGWYNARREQQKGGRQAGRLISERGEYGRFLFGKGVASGGKPC